MAKKYLSLEEAAALLGIETEELIRVREQGDIRGFADRGTWKFKHEDVEEYRRHQHPDSSPEVPMLGGDESDVSVLGSDGDSVSEQPTVIRGNSREGILEGTSDSDVRLIVDESLTGGDPDSDPEVVLPPLAESDSDVRLVNDRGGTQPDTESEIVLTDADSDSDVKLVGSDSDSDVRLVSESGILEAASDSDVQLISDADEDTVRMNLGEAAASGSSVLADDSGVNVEADEDSGLTLETESGISLQQPDSSNFLTTDSGISLDGADSGISLESIDSGISLDVGDSGIALEGVDDSGISLDDESGTYALADDSGIEVGSPSDSGLALETLSPDSDEMGATVSMDSAFEDDLESTQAEIGTPVVSGSGAVDGETSVILFDDEDQDSLIEDGSGEFDDFETLEGESFDMDDSFSGSAVDFDDDDLEVAEDVLGDSSGDFDEIESLDEMDVFDAADEDFEDSFVAGESQTEFTPSSPVSSVGRIAAPMEVEWGAGTFAALLISTLAMAACSMVMFDLVRSMWAWSNPSPYSSVLIDFFSGLFN